MKKDTRKGGMVLRKVSIEIPDREENEDPITNNQLRYIRKLAPDIKIEGGLENLGKWQASAIIDQIKEHQEGLESDISGGKINKGRKPKILFWIVVVAIIVYFIVKYLR